MLTFNRNAADPAVEAFRIGIEACLKSVKAATGGLKPSLLSKALRAIGVADFSLRLAEEGKIYVDKGYFPVDIRKLDVGDFVRLRGGGSGPKAR